MRRAVGFLLAVIVAAEALSTTSRLPWRNRSAPVAKAEEGWKSSVLRPEHLDPDLWHPSVLHGFRVGDSEFEEWSGVVSQMIGDAIREHEMEHYPIISLADLEEEIKAADERVAANPEDENHDHSEHLALRLAHSSLLQLTDELGVGVQNDGEEDQIIVSRSTCTQVNAKNEQLEEWMDLAYQRRSIADSPTDVQDQIGQSGMDWNSAVRDSSPANVVGPAKNGVITDVIFDGNSDGSVDPVGEAKSSTSLWQKIKSNGLFRAVKNFLDHIAFQIRLPVWPTLIPPIDLLPLFVVQVGQLKSCVGALFGIMKEFIKFIWKIVTTIARAVARGVSYVWRKMTGRQPTPQPEIEPQLDIAEGSELVSQEDTESKEAECARCEIGVAFIFDMTKLPLTIVNPSAVIKVVLATPAQRHLIDVMKLPWTCKACVSMVKDKIKSVFVKDYAVEKKYFDGCNSHSLMMCHLLSKATTCGTIQGKPGIPSWVSYVTHRTFSGSNGAAVKHVKASAICDGFKGIKLPLYRGQSKDPGTGKETTEVLCGDPKDPKVTMLDLQEGCHVVRKKIKNDRASSCRHRQTRDDKTIWRQCRSMLRCTKKFPTKPEFKAAKMKELLNDKMNDVEKLIVTNGMEEGANADSTLEAFRGLIEEIIHVDFEDEYQEDFQSWLKLHQYRRNMHTALSHPFFSNPKCSIPQEYSLTGVVGDFNKLLRTMRKQGGFQTQGLSRIIDEIDRTLDNCGHIDFQGPP